MRAKKQLGQHFLTSGAAIGKIINAANLSSSDIVLEIGPGKGVLTEKLLEHAKKVVAIEKDSELVTLLKEKFISEINSGKLVLVEEDILQSDITQWVSGQYKAVANIPYYITGEIIRKFLSSEHQPTSMVLLVQREVAQRIVAADGKESILSISVKAYGKPKYVATVGSRWFRPAPKVDSAILAINEISKERIGLNEATFFDTLHAGFAHKRKQLVGNLAERFDKNEVLEALSSLNLDSKIRAEELSIKDWLAVTKKLSK